MTYRDARHTIRVAVSDEHGIYAADAVPGEPLDCRPLEAFSDINDNGPVCAWAISAICRQRRILYGGMLGERCKRDLPAQR